MPLWHRHYHTIALSIPGNLAANRGLTGRWADYGVAMVLAPRVSNRPFADFLADIPVQIELMASQASAIGMPFCVGFRLMEGRSWSAARGWASVERWAENAQLLAVTKAALEQHGGWRTPEDLVLIPLDIEDYGDALPVEPDPAAALAAMAPFLANLEGVCPTIYPASVATGNGKVCYRHIMDAAAFGEVWGEEGFPRSDIERWGSVEGGNASPKEIGNENAVLFLRAEAHARWGEKVRVVQGCNDRLLRETFTSDATYNELRSKGFGWLFDSDRKAGQSDLQVGTEDWIKGRTIYSANDVDHIWTLNPFDDDGAVAPSGAQLAVTNVAAGFAWPPTEWRSQKGWMQRGGRGLWAANVIPKNAPSPGDPIGMKPFSILWRGQHPTPLPTPARDELEALAGHLDPFVASTGASALLQHDTYFDGPVLSGNASNGSSWQLLRKKDELELELMKAGYSPTGPVIHRVRFPLTDRLAIVRNGQVWTIYTPAAAVVVDPGWAVAPIQNLYVGVGNVTSVRNSPIASPGLVTRQLGLWYRALSSSEAAVVLNGEFPWKI